MIEEKNMLVFVEAIFTIEQLANLLGNNFKPATKVKALLTLVAALALTTVKSPEPSIGNSLNSVPDLYPTGINAKLGVGIILSLF